MRWMVTHQTAIAHLQEFVPTMKKGRPYTLDIRLFRKPRTLPQNALLHAIIGEIARSENMDTETVKAGIKEQYGVRQRVLLKDGPVEIAKPSHLCDTREMGCLIDGAIYEAAYLGIDVMGYKTEWEQIRGGQK